MSWLVSPACSRSQLGQVGSVSATNDSEGDDSDGILVTCAPRNGLGCRWCPCPDGDGAVAATANQEAVSLSQLISPACSQSRLGQVGGVSATNNSKRGRQRWHPRHLCPLYVCECRLVLPQILDPDVDDFDSSDHGSLDSDNLEQDGAGPNGNDRCQSSCSAIAMAPPVVPSDGRHALWPATCLLE